MSGPRSPYPGKLGVEQEGALADLLLGYMTSNAETVPEMTAPAQAASARDVWILRSRSREGAILRVEGESILLKGVAGARIFRRRQAPVEVTPVSEISPLLG